MNFIARLSLLFSLLLPVSCRAQKEKKNMNEDLHCRIHSMQTFNDSHFMQMIDGENTIIEVDLLHSDPPPGVKDGGQHIGFYLELYKDSEIELEKEYALNAPEFRARLEFIFDPSYDSNEAEDMEGKIIFHRVDRENRAFAFDLTVKLKGSSKWIAENAEVKCGKWE